MQTVIRFSPGNAGRETDLTYVMHTIGEKVKAIAPTLYDGKFDRHGGISTVISTHENYAEHRTAIAAAMRDFDEAIAFAQSNDVNVSFDTGIWLADLRGGRCFHVFTIDPVLAGKLSGLSIEYDLTIVHASSISGILNLLSAWLKNAFVRRVTAPRPCTQERKGDAFRNVPGSANA